MVTPKSKSNASQYNSPMLLIFSPAPEDHSYHLQMEQLERIRLALRDHHVIIAEIFENNCGRIGQTDLSADRCRQFRQHYHVPSGQFKIFLLGGDSVTHLSSEDCISWQELMMRMIETSDFPIPNVL